MKFAVILLILLLSLFAPHSPFSSAHVYNDDFSAWQKENLFKENKVWMVRGWIYPYENGVQIKKGRKTSFERFDRKGNRTEEVNYDINGKAIYSCEYFFDKNGNETQRSGISDNEVIDEKWEYAELDKEEIANAPEYENTIKQTRFYSDDKPENETEKNYPRKTDSCSCEVLNGKKKTPSDEIAVSEKQNKKENYVSSAGNKIIERKSVYKKSKDGKWFYKMNGRNNKLKEIHYDENGNFLYEWQFNYDERQRVREKKEYDAFGNVIQKWLYQYDDKGNNTEINE